jgi:hypothetical protein
MDSLPISVELEHGTLFASLLWNNANYMLKNNMLAKTKNMNYLNILDLLFQ